ncbi:hypothetical protein POF51_20210 [Brevibacillus sp. AG]|uniref:hypothetical protein n=1 Tax=Brevibacillus sp. AG TaxID=3020891 RepID=UPI00232F4BC9|nr:hypothetical protein [Brevibacillus sp. AG]MDC0763045.1 hypothetical protein [Brevibacillus sp. AG]
MNRFDEAAKRLNQIDWEKVGSVEEPWNMALVKEYIRRASVLIKTYSLKTPYPFFNAANILGFDMELELSEICPSLAKVNNSLITAMCVSYLEWAVLADRGEAHASQFSDLYEPIIKLFEKGGKVNRRHGEILAGGQAFPLANADYMSKQDPIDITDEGLENYNRVAIEIIMKKKNL